MYVPAKEATKYYNVTDQCLRHWANTGKIKYNTTVGGHRRYYIGNGIGGGTEPVDEPEKEQFKVIYSRVSSAKQRGDLLRQTEFLQSKYPTHISITDVGSGINYNRPGFKRILEGVFRGNIKEVVVAERDRFSRFGYTMFEWIFQQHQALLICDSKEDKFPRDELSEDLMAIITVFSARYHGKRKYKLARDADTEADLH